MNTEKIELSQYIVEHTICEPSKMSDYDYDPIRPNRRFISTYIHHLIFTDRITGINTLSLSFPSETCANLITSFYGILLAKLPRDDYQNPHPIVLSIRNIFVEGKSIPSTAVITNINDHIRLTVVSNGNSLCVSFNYNEAEAILHLLEKEEIIDMYVDYSDTMRGGLI